MNEPVSIYDVTLSDGDWYYIFARSEKEALRIVIQFHYDDMRTREFRKTYSPVITKVLGKEKILVSCEEKGQRNWTAKRWCKGEKPGPFTSNTYEY